MKSDLFGNPVSENVFLRDRFMEPPFSVLDSKGGDWQARKKAWKRLGIASEVGRDAACMPGAFGGEVGADGLDKYGRKPMSETSIFDPALCELIYNWYCPPGARVLDPFAGGSVRGIVANYLGHNYTGIDIRQEQVDSNREQAIGILPVNRQPQWYVGDSEVVLDGFTKPVPEEGTQQPLTPVERYGHNWCKREDLYTVCGASGAKARAAYYLIKNAIDAGAKVITTAGSRKSPQINIVAKICAHLNIQFVAHTPEGELGPDLLEAQRLGATILQHKAGYNNVIIARAKEWASLKQGYEVPFGMIDVASVYLTSEQVLNLPANVKRIVVPVGSGVNLAGILHGLKKFELNIPVMGVVVGADPEKCLDAMAPPDWRSMVELVRSEMDYHDEVKNNIWNGIVLDPVYEAKCIPHIIDGDLLWAIGARSSIIKGESFFRYFRESNEAAAPRQDNKKFDFVFSCPPYADLEKYSDDPADLSNMPYDVFIEKYRRIIKKSIDLLKTGGYACFVVGDIRDKRGYYRDFVSHTKRAFIDAGAGLYNEAILLQPLGTAMLRAAKIFEASGKLTKVHENVLVFKKQ